MPSTDLLIAFATTALIFAVMPGPAMLYATAQTLARGRRAGLLAVAGISLGGLVHVGLATAGLSAIFVLVPPAFVAVKLAGAAYLIWLGIQMFRSTAASAAARPQPTARRAFLQGVAVEVLNPKAALFFLALLPQFTDPAAAWPVAAQLLTLGTIVVLTFAVADIAVVLGAARISGRLARSPRAGAWVRRLGGAMLVGLGAKLALERA